MQIIGALKTRCSCCDSRFKVGNTYFSSLSLKEDQWERCDFCIECWKEQHKEEMSCTWKGRILEKAEAAVELLPGDKRLLALFLQEEERKERTALLSFLAQYFHRRGLFKKEGTLKEDGQTQYVYVSKVDKACYLVPYFFPTAEQRACFAQEIHTKMIT